ncbi:hypothetical protein F502_03457 [Clostridium pasteurianum DSM 525 = ATCC 6013]|nr:hypothetical protein AQ983_11025 [Clostridium pasteurianum DSM 525 = ATCC 6013]AOZ79384.1 hypothetical protein AQ984_11020 [Clostridium pasteurianum]ELP60510.1 hypothetical protein F502_03457 [Clostridium pasteurianum DSM 525 = ATCC 6013]
MHSIIQKRAGEAENLWIPIMLKITLELQAEVSKLCRSIDRYLTRKFLGGTANRHSPQGIVSIFLYFFNCLIIET